MSTLTSFRVNSSNNVCAINGIYVIFDGVKNNGQLIYILSNPSGPGRIMYNSYNYHTNTNTWNIASLMDMEVIQNYKKYNQEFNEPGCWYAGFTDLNATVISEKKYDGSVPAYTGGFNVTRSMATPNVAGAPTVGYLNLSTSPDSGYGDRDIVVGAIIVSGIDSYGIVGSYHILAAYANLKSAVYILSDPEGGSRIMYRNSDDNWYVAPLDVLYLIIATNGQLTSSVTGYPCGYFWKKTLSDGNLHSGNATILTAQYVSQCKGSKNCYYSNYKFNVNDPMNTGVNQRSLTYRQDDIVDVCDPNANWWIWFIVLVAVIAAFVVVVVLITRENNKLKLHQALIKSQV